MDALPHTASRGREEEQRAGGWQAVDPGESAWSLDEADGPPGARRRLLLVSLARPPLTDTEVTWKKGARRGAGTRLDTPRGRLACRDDSLSLIGALLRTGGVARAPCGQPRLWPVGARQAAHLGRRTARCVMCCAALPALYPAPLSLACPVEAAPRTQAGGRTTGRRSGPTGTCARACASSRMMRTSTAWRMCCRRGPWRMQHMQESNAFSIDLLPTIVANCCPLPTVPHF